MIKSSIKNVAGEKFYCPEYIQCPICYGCRNYNPSLRMCRELCKEKKDVCDMDKHQAELLGKFYAKKNVYRIPNMKGRKTP